MADYNYDDNLNGQRFGEWKVVEDRGFWCLCRCKCGTVDTVRRDRLLRRLSESCGHCTSPTICESGSRYADKSVIPVIRTAKKHRKRTRYKSIIGKHFGTLEVVEEWKDGAGVNWCRCRCECGNIKDVRRGNLIAENTRTCGRHKRII